MNATETQNKVRSQFPIFGKHPGLAYLDYANTSLKPQRVIDAITGYYTDYSANVHRANHELGSLAEEAFEGSRDRIAQWFGVTSDEVVWTRGTTEAINLVAHGFVAPMLQEGDEILITHLEHHANMVPWQQIALRKGAKLVVAPVLPNGELDLEKWKASFTDKTKFAAFVHISNVTGLTNPVKEMAAYAKERGVPTLLDAAQSVPHYRLNLADLGVDFLAFSAHKTYGPTGIGALVGRYELLEKAHPLQFGGDMIDVVTLAGSTFQSAPRKFESGTPPIAAAIGLGAAIDFLDEALTPELANHEHQLMNTLLNGLEEIDGIRFIGGPSRSAHLVSFVVDGVHSADIGAYLNEKNVAVRVGKLCAHPLLDAMGCSSAIRVSIGAPTQSEEIEAAVKSIHAAVRMFKR